MQKETGKLFIVSTPIGNLEDITYRAVDTLKNVDLILAEDTRHSAKLISHFQISKKLIAFHDHNEKSQYMKIIEKLKDGLNIALISDAGTPLINDPGFNLVRSAKQENINVVPIPGASSPIAALSASGLPADSFTFLGFVPTKDSDRINFLEKLKYSSGTSIFFESPSRILKTTKLIKEIFGSKRNVCLAKEISKIHETIITGDIDEIIHYLEESSDHQKGEFVVLVGGLNYKEIDEKLVLLNEIIPHLLKEMSASKAAKLAAKITSLDKDTCYKAIIEK
ncbi:MAG: 16S rRNA (cytidine(1402)-2'-O)-methyltransferase [Gammaproteobacteria bacterium]|jgi:16S rRNA (cytidine1402-2'-O)-methyltransferase